MRRIFVVLAVAALCAGCRSAGKEEATLGKLPQSVFTIYHAGTPGGWMEIEAAADGTILEAEADWPVSKLPPDVLAAAERDLPGGEITGAELELRRGMAFCFEVKKRVGGLEYELVYDSGARLIEKEIEMSFAEGPAVVLSAAERAMPGGEMKSLERIERGGETEYHIKFAREGGSYKVVVSPEGTVLRRVREAKTEIEIPLDGEPVR